MMKKISVIFTFVLLLFLSISHVSHAEKNSSVYDMYQKDSNQSDNKKGIKKEEQTPSIFPVAAKFIFSFLFIIVLLFIFLKFLGSKTKGLQTNGVFHALGGHSFGNQRSIQLLMIGDTLYIVGVGDNIQLLREIPPGEEQDALLNMLAVEQAKTMRQWFPLKKGNGKSWEDMLHSELYQNNKEIPIKELERHLNK
jgi:flagellar protein FliO/FliZ